MINIDDLMAMSRNQLGELMIAHPTVVTLPERARGFVVGALLEREMSSTSLAFTSLDHRRAQELVDEAVGILTRQAPQLFGAATAAADADTGCASLPRAFAPAQSGAAPPRGWQPYVEKLPPGGGGTMRQPAAHTVVVPDDGSAGDAPAATSASPTPARASTKDSSPPWRPAGRRTAADAARPQSQKSPPPPPASSPPAPSRFAGLSPSAASPPSSSAARPKPKAAATARRPAAAAAAAAAAASAAPAPVAAAAAPAAAASSRAKPSAKPTAASAATGTAEASKRGQHRAPALPGLPPPVVPLPPVLTNGAAFFGEWLQVGHRLQSGTWVSVDEIVSCPAASAGAAAPPPCVRRMCILLCGKSRAVTSNDVVVRDGARATATAQLLLQPDADTLPVAHAAMRKNALQMLARKSHQLRQFHACVAVLRDGDGQRFGYGDFPLVPNTVSPDGTWTHVSYATLTVLPPDQWPKAPAATAATIAGLEAPSTAPDGTGRGASVPMWTVSTDTSDAVVDAVLASLGAPLTLERRVADGPQRQAFRQLAASAIAGYDASSDAAVRDAKLRRLFALVRMHCRRLVGSASPALRERFAMAQLSGAVCTQRVQERRPSQAAPPTDDEHSERCVRAAFRLASAGHLGRAAATLTRAPPVTIDPAQKLADLRALHPDGPPAENIVLPATPVFNRENVTVAALRDIVRASQHDSSPGPDGWTFEALGDALEHDGFAVDFRAVIVDVCNGHVAPGTSKLLAASSLIGLAKGKTAADGTRPIALGSTFLKVAAGVSLAEAAVPLKATFDGIQFGCATKGGADFIVHATRRFLRSGVWPEASRARAGSKRCIATIDFANAFNTPLRQSMWLRTQVIPALVGLFSTSYGIPADLFVVGIEAVIPSRRGARQGTVDGGVTFALTLHPVLHGVNSFPGVRLLAYLDDVTVLAETPELCDAAIAAIIKQSAVLGMTVKLAKCEFLPFDGGPPPPGSTLCGFRAVSALKLLGASIARTDPEEAAHLLAREGAKAEVALRRLRGSPSPQFFAVLRSCVLPKLSHAVRVHPACVTRELCQRFDASIEDVVAHWASVASFGERQRMLLGLPRDMGGLGLTRTEMIAAAAHHASLTAALSDASKRVYSQASLCAVVYRAALARVAAGDAELLRHLQVYALPGSDASLSCTAVRVNADVFGALLRTYTMADASTVSGASLPCRGCNRDFAVGGAWGEHVSSCVVGRGGHVTRRHNAVASLLRHALAEAGCVPDATEPRDMARYSCACGFTNLPHAEYIAHKNACPKAATPLHTSGPDLRWSSQGRTLVGDVTIVNLLTATHAHQGAEDAFAEAVRTKEAAYGDLCAAANASLITLPATANGHLGRQVAKIANACSDASFRERRALRERLSATIAHGSAAARLAAEDASGVRPPTRDMEMAALQVSFDAASRAPEAAPVALPPLLSAPVPYASVVQRIAFGVSEELRRELPGLAQSLVVEAIAIERANRRRALARRRRRDAREAAAALSGVRAVHTDSDAEAAPADDDEDEAEAATTTNNINTNNAAAAAVAAPAAPAAQRTLPRASSPEADDFRRHVEARTETEAAEQRIAARAAATSAQLAKLRDESAAGVAACRNATAAAVRANAEHEQRCVQEDAHAASLAAAAERESAQEVALAAAVAAQLAAAQRAESEAFEEGAALVEASEARAAAAEERAHHSRARSEASQQSAANARAHAAASIERDTQSIVLVRERSLATADGLRTFAREANVRERSFDDECRARSMHGAASRSPLNPPHAQRGASLRQAVSTPSPSACGPSPAPRPPQLNPHFAGRQRASPSAEPTPLDPRAQPYRPPAAAAAPAAAPSPAPRAPPPLAPRVPPPSPTTRAQSIVIDERDLSEDDDVSDDGADADEYSNNNNNAPCAAFLGPPPATHVAHATGTGCPSTTSTQALPAAYASSASSRQRREQQSRMQLIDELHRQQHHHHGHHQHQQHHHPYQHDYAASPVAQSPLMSTSGPVHAAPGARGGGGGGGFFGGLSRLWSS